MKNVKIKRWKQNETKTVLQWPIGWDQTIQNMSLDSQKDSRGQNKTQNS